MTISKKDVTVVLPTKDEEEAIGTVIEELHEIGFDNLLVVDGHSDDKTTKITEKKGVEVVYQEGEGKADAVEKGIREVETPYLALLDADWTYPAGDLPKLLDIADEHDHVVGERSDRGSIPLLHRLGNWGINLVFDILMETDSNDILSGMYLLRTESAKDLEFPFSGFECEVTICAQMVGETAEVPIGYRDRIGKKELSGFWGLKRILEATYPLSLKFGDPSFFRRLAAKVITWIGIIGGFVLSSLGRIGHFLIRR